MAFVYFEFLEDSLRRDASHLHVGAFELGPRCFILLIFVDLLKVHSFPSGACAVVDG